MENLDRTIDPTNVGCERSFGLLKMYESKFETAGLSNLFNLTISKYNKCSEFIKQCDDDVLLLANR